VWHALREIPVGRTASYGELAAKLGLSGHGARAVGMANGDNPIAVVVPCHRVIGKDGTLVGYGGGLPRKEWLLRHEGALLV
jgi:methylated-DNA-[protein]-cysteine S-methyltransferase